MQWLYISESLGGGAFFQTHADCHRRSSPCFSCTWLTSQQGTFWGITTFLDHLSCPDQNLPTEWSLFSWYLTISTGVRSASHGPICHQGEHKASLFTCHPFPDLMAWKEVALQHQWDDLSIYAFPSFALLRQVLVERCFLAISP